MELSFLHQHEAQARTVCILLHGLSGSTEHLKELAEILYHQGNHVLAPELSGHADLAKLASVSYDDWIEDVKTALKIAQGISAQPVIIIGMSLGGLLALNAATNFTNNILALAVLSAPLCLRSKSTEFFLTVLSLLPDYLLNRMGSVRKRATTDEPQLGETHSVAALARLIGLRRATLKKLASIKQPLLLMQDPYDYHLTPEATFIAAEGVSSKFISQHFIIKAAHKMTVAQRAADVTRLVTSFVERVKNQENRAADPKNI